MEESRSQVLRRIDWLELFPWLRLLRAATLALKPQVWLLVIAGIVMTNLGSGLLKVWYAEAGGRHPRGIPSLLEKGPPLLNAPIIERLLGPAEADQVRTHEGKASPALFWWDTIAKSGEILWPILEPWRSIGRCFTTLVLVPQENWGVWLIRVLHAFWVFAVWSMCGGAIVRWTAMVSARAEPISLESIVRFALARAPRVLACLAGFLLAVYVLGTLCAGLAELAYLVSLLGIALDFTWLLPTLAGLLVMLVAVIFIFGWPFMVAAVMVDNQDGYGAVGAASSYIFRRPFHIAFYALVAGIVGLVFASLIGLFAACLFYTTMRVVAWGCSPTVQEVAESGLVTLEYILLTFASFYVFGQFWTSVAIMYLLVRQHVDETDWDEVYVEEPCWKAGDNTGRVVSPPQGQSLTETSQGDS